MKNLVIRGYPDQIEAWISKAQSVDHNVSWWVRHALNAAASGNLRVRFTDPQVRRGVAADETVQQFQIKATVEELEFWTQAAGAHDLERSEWFRQVLDAAAEKSDQSFLVRLTM